MPVTNYVWDGDQYLMETDESNTTQAVFTNEPDEFTNLTSQRRNGATHFAHFDGLGSTRQLTDASETVTDQRIYGGFGNMVSHTGTTEFPFWFVGRFGYYYDPETDTVYVIHRILEPENGRWLSVDPVITAFAKYLYVGNGPVNRIDPFGLYFFPGGAGGHWDFRNNPRLAGIDLCSMINLDVSKEDIESGFELFSRAVQIGLNAGMALFGDVHVPLTRIVIRKGSPCVRGTASFPNKPRLRIEKVSGPLSCLPTFLIHHVIETCVGDLDELIGRNFPIRSENKVCNDAEVCKYSREDCYENDFDLQDYIRPRIESIPTYTLGPFGFIRTQCRYRFSITGTAHVEVCPGTCCPAPLPQPPRRNPPRKSDPPRPREKVWPGGKPIRPGFPVE